MRTNIGITVSASNARLGESPYRSAFARDACVHDGLNEVMALTYFVLVQHEVAGGHHGNQCRQQGKQ